MSTITMSVRRTVLARDLYRCQRCGKFLGVGQNSLPSATYSLQHRLARKMGGRHGAMVEVVDGPANLVTLCGHATTRHGCHTWAESRATEANEQGYVLREGQDPATSPLLTYHGWVLLDTEGGVSVTGQLYPDEDAVPPF